MVETVSKFSRFLFIFYLYFSRYERTFPLAVHLYSFGRGSSILRKTPVVRVWMYSFVLRRSRETE